MSLTIWEVLGVEEQRKPMKVLKKAETVQEFEYPLHVQAIPEGTPCLLMCYEGVFYIFSVTGKQLKGTRDLISKIKMSTSEREPFIMYCILQEDSFAEETFVACLDIYQISEFLEGEIILPWSLRRCSINHLLRQGFLGYKPFSLYIGADETTVLSGLGKENLYAINNKANLKIGEEALHLKEVTDL